MSVSLGGAADYLVTTTLPIAAFPYSFCGWFKLDDLSVSRCICSIGDKDSATEFQELYIVSTTTFVRIMSFNGAPPQYAESDTSPTAADGNWYLAVGTVDTESRFAYLNANPGAENTTAEAFSANHDNYTIGVRHTMAVDFFDGLIAEIAIYNKVLSGAEVTSLQTMSPYLVARANLVSYVPLRSDYYDVIQGVTFAAGGAPSISTDHPPLIYPTVMRRRRE